MSSATTTSPGLEQAAVRKLIYQLAELGGEEMDPDENTLIDAANQGLENLQELQERVEQLEAETEVLKDRAPDPSRKQYNELNRPEKATVVRSKMKKQAEKTGGTAAIDYNDVVRMFDGHPSAGHAYDIMETAGEADGYNYGNAPDGSKRLTYNAEKA